MIDVVFIGLFSDDEFVVDDDVLREKDKVLFNSELVEQNQVVISGLTKFFGPHKAVDDVYLAVPKGECFGLLGNLPTRVSLTVKWCPAVGY